MMSRSFKCVVIVAVGSSYWPVTIIGATNLKHTRGACTVRNYVVDKRRIEPCHLAEYQGLGRHDQRVGVSHVDQCEPAHPGPRLRIGGQQRRLRVLLLEIFENGQRLEELDITVDQGWDDHLRIDRAVRIGELVALLEVQEAVLPRDALQVQRDARAETRLLTRSAS
jgi:hypothetical protein